jgi:hypothetical protein
MNSDAAFSLASDWVRSHGADQAAAQASHSALSAELVGLLPDVEDASIAVIEGTPTIVALDANMMLSVSADSTDEQADEITWRFRWVVRSLQPGGGRVTLLDDVYATGNVTKRHRTWEYQLPDGDAFAISGSETVRGGYSEDRRPDNNEVSARLIAKALGWRLPAPDEYR